MMAKQALTKSVTQELFKRKRLKLFMRIFCPTSLIAYLYGVTLSFFLVLPFSAFAIEGNLRSTVLGVDTLSSPALLSNGSAEVLSQTLLRLSPSGLLGDDLNYEVHLVQRLDLSSTSINRGGTLLAPEFINPRDQLFDFTWEQADDDRVAARLWPDRFNLKWALPGIDITFGRQAITFGQTYFWNVLDVFFPFDARQFDRDYKAGVDALRMDITLGSLSGLSLIAAAGREVLPNGEYLNGDTLAGADWYGSSLFVHAFTNYKNWDVHLQGGKIYGGAQLGLGTTGEIRPIQVRMEGAYYWAQENDTLGLPFFEPLIEDSFTAVLGIGHTFPSTLSLQTEYFFNGASDSDSLETSFLRVLTGNTLQVSEQLWGAMISYDVTPIFNARLGGIISLDDGSFQVLPNFTYSPSGETELLFGAILNIGEDPTGTVPADPKLQSEFGTFSNIYYLEGKLYF